MKTFSLPILLFVCGLGMVGCGSSSIYVSVRASINTNERRPFYMVVRNVDQKAYVTETYQEVAKKVFDDPEKSVVKTETIYPGKEIEVELEKQEKFPISIYFLFTHPGGNWKAFFPQPLPEAISFEIDGHEIKKQN